MDITDFMPDGFNLRAGAGGGDLRNGMCYMEAVAFIAGEKITDKPACVCPIITKFGIRLNDKFNDEERKLLLPLVWATAGTRSKAHELQRLKILKLTTCDLAEIVLPIFEEKYPNDNRPRAAIEAAREYIGSPSTEKREALSQARTASYLAADAAAAAYAAAYAADTYTAYVAADAAVNAVNVAVNVVDAADAAVNAADAAVTYAEKRNRVVDRAVQGLREMIEAGPNGGIPEQEVTARIAAKSIELT